MNWLRNFFKRLFTKKSAWDGYNYGKPSTEGDDFRRMNDE